MIKFKDILNESTPIIDSKFNFELLTKINDNYGENYTKISPMEINDGYCDMWAELFVDKFGGKHQWSFDFPNEVNGHSWVKLNNKYYDAEATKGVFNLEDLPFFKRIISKNGSKWLNADFIKGINN
jgi:hypothetical protein